MAHQARLSDADHPKTNVAFNYPLPTQQRESMAMAVKRRSSK
jgi:hypothetical protein